jgi:conjugative transfer signal peptidase TraF
MSKCQSLPKLTLQITGLFALLWAATWACGVRVNTSASLPMGLWVESARLPSNGLLTRGAIVTFCPSDAPPFRLAKQRGYIGGGWCPHEYQPLFKPIAAVAGDQVSISPAGIDVNGVHIANSAPLRADNTRQPLPTPRYGKYIVQPGSIWLVSSYNSRSFDSRYFGSVQISNVRSIVVPLWVRGHAYD